MINLFKKIQIALEPFKNLLWISLATWVTHIILRFLMLFRANPYGFPFVSKPDWYIFHAICLDFMWICNALILFAIVAMGVNYIAHQKRTIKKNEKLSKAITVIYAVFHSAVLAFTLLDNEMQRFLGSHISFGLLNTYKDVSSIAMLWDYVANDYSVPFLQFFVLVTMLPFTYYIYRFLRKHHFSYSRTLLSMLIFYVASFLFVYFIWTGNARMKKLKPLVSIILTEFIEKSNRGSLSEKDVLPYAITYQNLWQKVEGDSLWEFAKSENVSTPLFRVPKKELTQSEALARKRALKPNFIVIFMESHRGLNTGFLNPNEPSPTPFYDSIAAHSHIWERMHTSGLPTTGGVLSSHVGIPHHSKLAQATDLAHINMPSFASILKDSGYVTHYFSAADPAWDNLGVWMSKWYTAQHYNRNREDDSTFFDYTSSYVIDTLAKNSESFLATITTRSNHYPFNFAAGLTDEQKNLPLTERIKITMNYADRQLARFIHSIEKEEWYKNTYVIILADHGFPLGENNVSTMNGGGFSNATWIPFIIHGNGIEPKRDTSTAAQLDIAPTIMELAGLAVPNMFMGHNLLRGYGNGLSLGAYSNVAAIGYEGYRLIAKYPLHKSNPTGLFHESDTHQKIDLTESKVEIVNHLNSLLDTLIKISDYSLERGM